MTSTSNVFIMSLFKIAVIALAFSAPSVPSTHGLVEPSLFVGQTINCHPNGGGTIVMDDIILAVTVNDAQDDVQQVLVKSLQGTVVFQAGGCGSNHCTYNLSALAEGTYNVVVTTQSGDQFSDQIVR